MLSDVLNSRPHLRSRIQFKYFSEFSHNVLYYQQLSIVRYQVSFYANVPLNDTFVALKGRVNEADHSPLSLILIITSDLDYLFAEILFLLCFN